MKKYLIIFLLFFLTWCSSNKSNINNNVSINSWNNFSNCTIQKVLENINWVSMEPLLKHWWEMYLLKDYYKCWNTPKLWDIVAYDYKWAKNLLIKIIKADSNSIVEFSWNTLLINWKQMKNSIWDIYKFNDNEIKLMKIYINNNKLPQNSYLIFWDNTVNSRDSRNFWAISVDNIVWKFELN